MPLATGTSGFAFKEWKGPFYPEKLPDKDMLPYYAERFAAVEINNTFYRMPRESVLTGWAELVPPGFRFCLKAPQKITHIKRLQDVGDEVGYFLRVASVLGERLGPTLFQLPPTLKKDLPRLEAFLALLPRRWHAAIEFRHASWFDDGVFALLRAKDVALCVADTEDLETPLVATADWGYVRLHREAYADDALIAWAGRLRETAWIDTFVFFKHDHDKTGPAAARRFADMLGAG
ncbi:MAG: DUF72 domain-containing protein [Gemmatimonadota bacterium]